MFKRSFNIEFCFFFELQYIIAMLPRVSYHIAIGISGCCHGPFGVAIATRNNIITNLRWSVFDSVIRYFSRMKPEDRLQILPSSPISVLESTRKDFEALLGSANSSSEEVQERKTKQTNQSKRHRFKKQEKHRNSVKEHVELRELSSVQNKTIINVGLQQNLVKVKSHTNPSFWYEDEQQNEISSSSLNSEKLKKVKSSSNSPELVHSSSVERATIHHERRASPAITNSSDDENNSDNVLSVAPSVGSQHTRTSISSSHPAKINSNKESHKNSRQTSLKNLYSSASSSSDHNIEEENSVGYQELNETLSLEHSILKIVVHQCDRLILDQPKSQPLIVVHAVSCKTGRYMVNNKVPVSPQCTGSCIAHSPHQVSNKSNALPEWNQEMVFDLDADKYLSEILFLFELVSEPNTTVSSLLAWGFLRPMSRTGVKHIGKKLQLQLYKTPARRLLGHATPRPTISDLFHLFNSAQKEKYPATLYVTLLSSGSSKSSTVTKESRFNVTSPLRGGRLSGQPFKLPTRRGFTYESAAAGALIACYRSDGSSLAFALSTGDIMVYQNSVISLHLKGHQGNVYDLEWNKNEGGEGWRLLSCGADCTARVWNDSNDVVLSHPAYVYSARFGESDDRVVTGCFDQLIRLWELNSSSPRLISTYVQHRAPINSLCWDSHGRLFSADAKGSICVWNSTISGLYFEKYLLFFIVILRDSY
jgi:hypothetical protein